MDAHGVRNFMVPGLSQRLLRPCLWSALASFGLGFKVYGLGFRVYGLGFRA